VNQICQLLGISKKTYYQSQEPQERLAEKYQALRPVLGRLIEKHPSYGVPRLKKALTEQEGLVVTAKLLRKLLRVWGLSWQRKAGAGQRKKTWVQRVVESLGPRANLVRHIPITACFQVLVTDMTQLPFEEGIAYLCVHLDWYGKLVLGWELSLHPDTPLALASLQMALAAIKEWKGGILDGLIVHQDQGSPYTSGDYVTTIRESQAYVSYSRCATPGDNPVNEAFFSRLKAEWGEQLTEAKTLKALRQLVSQAIAYYNTERYHTSIGCQTPAQFTQQFFDHLTLESP
jgi:putative transposase